MRVVVPTLLALTGLLLVDANYFSDGWQPGQPPKSLANPTATYSPGGPVPTRNAPPGSPSKSSSGWVESILTSEPIQDLLLKAGINITQKFEEARIKEENLWDKRVPLIHDRNFNELIRDENLTPSEEAERVWFIIISISRTQKEGVSAMFDQVFDNAYDLTAKAKDLKHVKWGRIDYMNVTRITTKWNVWRAPLLVLAADRGKTLRFLDPRYLRADPQLMRTWLADKSYLESPVWQSAFGPGGKREFVYDFLAVVFEKWYDISTTVPRWAIYAFTGMFASFLIQFMHRSSASPNAPPTTTTVKKAIKPPIEPQPEAPKETSSSASGAQPSTSAPAKKRKK